MTFEEIEAKKKQDTYDYRARQREYEKLLDKAVKEKYGEDINCSNCRYGCLLNVYDYCTDCLNNECIPCRGLCRKYEPETKTSKYLREKHHYGHELGRCLGLSVWKKIFRR